MKKILQKFFAWINGLLKTAQEKYLDAAVAITNAVKDAISNPLVDWLTILDKSGVSAKVIAVLRQKLPGLVSTLTLVSDLKPDATEAEINAVLANAFSIVAGLPAQEKAEFYTRLAAKVYIILEDGEVSFGEAAGLVEYFYQSKKAA